MNQGMEAHWKSKNLEKGKFTRDHVEKIFEKAETGYLKKFLDKLLKLIEHEPCGINNYQPALLRGEGLWEPKGTLYKVAFRRLTQQKMRKMLEDGAQFYIERGARFGFTKTF